MKIDREIRALGSLIDPEIWRQAHGLARTLHREDEIALQIAVLAASRLETACRRQRGRRRYQPKLGRRKVNMDQAQMLQQLVLEESERWERFEEQSRDQITLDEDSWIVRYVKHLVQISMSRNLFHVTVAICRLLYGYSTRNTLKIYDRLAVDPLCAQDETYLRARKKLLIGELLRRFGAKIELSRGARGEMSFRGTKVNRHHKAVVEEILRRLTPWHTRCPSDLKCDGHFQQDATALRDRATSSQHAARRSSEMAHIHILLHPPCFAKLTHHLGMAAPAGQLRLPNFRSTQ